jgi:hypothetical protein
LGFNSPAAGQTAALAGSAPGFKTADDFYGESRFDVFDIKTTSLYLEEA